MNSRFSSDASADEISVAISENGYAIVENAIGPDTLASVNSELNPHFESRHQGHDDFMGRQTIRFGALLSKSTSVQSLVAHEQLLCVVDNLLLDYCVNYHIHYTGVMQLQPGEKAQQLHRDTGIFPIANPSPPLTIATMWALNEFTALNGGTVFVPGSHKWADDRIPREDELLSVEMPAGSVLIYQGNAIHGGGNNKSDGVRSGLAIHYGLGWLRQEENQYLAMSPEEVRELPLKIQNLLGYDLAGPSFGIVDHIHPRDYINGVRDVGESSVWTHELAKRNGNLKRFHISKAEAGRLNSYQPEEAS